MKLFGYTIIPSKDYEALCKYNDDANNLALERKAVLELIQYGWDADKYDERYYIAYDTWNKQHFKVIYEFKLGNEIYRMPVKRFFFDLRDEDDVAYAKRCAEELLEKLEEKI